MGADLAALTEGFQALPLPQLIAVAIGVVFLTALLMRILGNKFHGNTPPIDEGIPFVGGLIKFSKVSYFFLDITLLISPGGRHRPGLLCLSILYPPFLLVSRKEKTLSFLSYLQFHFIYRALLSS